MQVNLDSDRLVIQNRNHSTKQIKKDQRIEPNLLQQYRTGYTRLVNVRDFGELYARVREHLQSPLVSVVMPKLWLPLKMCEKACEILNYSYVSNRQ